MVAEEVIIRRLQADSAQSDRSLSLALGCSTAYVRRVRRDLESSGAIPRAIVRVGLDGRRRSAHGFRTAVKTNRKRPPMTKRQASTALDAVVKAALAGDVQAAMWALDYDREARVAA